jgi:hypothetical protein
MTRDEVKAKLIERMKEGLAPKDREKWDTMGTETSDNVLKVKTELTATHFATRAFFGIDSPDCIQGALRSLVELGVTAKISKDQMLARFDQMYTELQATYNEHGEKGIEAATDLIMKVNGTLDSLTKGASIQSIEREFGKSVAKDALEGFDLGDKDTKMIAVPKDWDKNVN